MKLYRHNRQYLGKNLHFLVLKILTHKQKIKIKYFYYLLNLYASLINAHWLDYMPIKNII